jgi:regulator of RNase E activity RraA
MTQSEREALLDAFRPYRSAQVVDALYFLNAAHLLTMDPGMKPVNLKPRQVMHGFAFTLRYVPTQDPFPLITPEERASVIRDPVGLMFEGGRGGLSDPNQWMTNHIKHRETLDTAEKHDVIVYDGARTPHVHWGGSINMQAVAMGVAGGVGDCGVRDVVEIQETDMPVFARYVSNVFHSPWVELADVNGSVVCGGVQVRPGDLIIGDEGGVVVVPAGLASEVAELLSAIQTTDDVIQAKWSSPPDNDAN